MTFSLRDINNPLIRKGLTAQFAARRARIAAGEKPLGWKVGFGAPAAMQRLGLQAPLVGFLMQDALLPSGSAVSLRGWTKPVAEPEIAVRMATDLSGDASDEMAAAAIGEVLPAIELADLNLMPAPDNLDAVLENNIYQRHVILSSDAKPGASLDGLVSQVERRGVEFTRTDDLEALTGNLTSVVAHVANTLAAFDQKLAADDIIITGSITPPIMLESDELSLSHHVNPIGKVLVRFFR